MKTLKSLADVAKFMKRNHSGLNARSEDGIFGMQFLKKSTGEREMTMDIRGFKIVDIKVDNMDLILQIYAGGYSFKGQRKHVISSRLFLRNLVLINMYDHCAQFYSNGWIDFAYVEENLAAQIEHFTEWIYGQSNEGSRGVLRAQWVAPYDDIDKILDEVVDGRLVYHKLNAPRLIDMDADGV